MTICDICGKGESAQTNQYFERSVNGMTFVVVVTAIRPLKKETEICQNCAAKAIATVMGYGEKKEPSGK